MLRGGLSHQQLWIAPIILLVFLSSLILITLLLAGSYRILLLIVALVSLPFLVFFGFRSLYLYAIGITTLFYGLSRWRINSELSTYRKIGIYIIGARNMWLIVTPFLVMTSFAYYATPAVQQVAEEGTLPVAIQNLVENTAGFILEQQIIELPAGQQIQTKDKVVTQVIRGFSSIIKKNVSYVPPLLAFGLFLVLEGLSLIFVYLSMALSVFIFYLLKRHKFFSIDKKTAEVEVLNY